MAELYDSEEDVPKKKYWDKQSFSSFEEQNEAMKKTSTVYVGNMSFYTTELQIIECFGIVGRVERVVMGLDRFKKTPCGFCFVEFQNQREALDSTYYISGTKLDDRVIRVGLDAGFREGRQYGRGNSGGQVRDERRSKDHYDPGRGGYGKGDDKSAQGFKPFRRNDPKRRRVSEEDSSLKPDTMDEVTAEPEEINPRFRANGDNDDQEDSNDPTDFVEDDE